MYGLRLVHQIALLTLILWRMSRPDGQEPARNILWSLLQWQLDNGHCQAKLPNCQIAGGQETFNLDGKATGQAKLRAWQTLARYSSCHYQISWIAGGIDESNIKGQNILGVGGCPMLRIFSQSWNESMSLKLSAKRRSLVGWQLKSQIVSLAGLISPISPFTKSVPIVQREKYYIVFGALCQNIQPKLQ